MSLIGSNMGIFDFFRRKKKTVGVVIPTYNRRGRVDATIDSYLNQDYDGKSLIVVVDDGSIDGTFEHLVEKYADNLHSTDDKISGHVKSQKKGNLIVVRQKNQHSSAARNTGLKLLYSLGCDYFTHQDASDVALPTKLKDLTAFLEKNKGTHIVHAKAHDIDLDGKRLPNGPYQRYFKNKWPKAASGGYKQGDLKGENFIHHNTTMFTRDLIDELGLNNLYWEGLKRAQDWDFHIKIDNNDLQFGFLDKYVAASVVYDPDSITGLAGEKRSVKELTESAMNSEDKIAKMRLYQLALTRSSGDRSKVFWTQGVFDDWFSTAFSFAFRRNVALNKGDVSNAYLMAKAAYEMNPTNDNRLAFNQLDAKLSFFLE